MFEHTFFWCFFFFKNLNPQVRTKKLINCCLLPFSLKISLRNISFQISLIFLGFYPSPEYLLNFLWLVYSTMCGEFFFQFLVFTFRENALNLCILLYPSPPLKTPGRIFENLFPPRQKGWRKLWFILSKFNQKIWRWLGTLVYLHFVWFVFFLNVMALQFCE